MCVVILLEWSNKLAKKAVMLRDVHEELWDEVHVRAIRSHKKMATWVEEAIREKMKRENSEALKIE